MAKTLYMVVTNDELELPLFVSEYLEDIVRYTGKSKSCIKSTLSRYYSGQYKKVMFRRVRIDEDEEEK